MGWGGGAMPGGPSGANMPEQLPRAAPGSSMQGVYQDLLARAEQARAEAAAQGDPRASIPVDEKQILQLAIQISMGGGQ